MALVNTTFSDLITFARYSNATYVGSNGVVSYADLDAPRFTYNPTTLAPLGFLIEEQRANYISSSIDFNLGWTYQNSAIDSFSVGSPDSSNLTSVCYGIQPTGSAGANTAIYFSVTKAATAITYTQSLWVKGDTSAFNFSLDNGGSINRGVAVFDLTNGTLVSVASEGTFSNTSATITQYLNNSWYRITLTTTSNTSTTVRFHCFYTSAGSSAPIVYVYGPQLEIGEFATSYIVADGAIAVRAADQASINTLSPWYNATEGTVYAQVQLTGLSTTKNQNTALLSDGTNSNKIGTYRASAGTANATVFGSTITGSSWVTTSTRKLALGSKSGDSVLVDNGVIAGTSSATTAQTVSNFRLGSNAAADDEFLNGYLQRVVYYPKRLTNSELQALTT